MQASTVVSVGLDREGRTVVRSMRCEAPMLMRVVEPDGPTLHLALVNGAAGPLGGDTLRFRLDIGPGADVTVRSVAAAMAQPGARGDRSIMHVHLDIGERASLRWAPEPMVSVAGSDHRTIVTVDAAASAVAVIREGVSLGRHGQPSGRLALRQRVTIDGCAVLDHETEFAPGALSGPGAQGNGRTITSQLHIGGELPPVASHVTDGCSSATFHLSPTCALTSTTSV
jgi:urease accessory protein